MEVQISKSIKVDTYFNDLELELIVPIIKTLATSNNETLLSVRFFIILDLLYCDIHTTKNSTEDSFFGLLYSKPFSFSLQNIGIHSTKLTINRLSGTDIERVRTFLENL